MTSLVAGVLGFGGGMLLISILPFFLAPAAIIPVHGIVQLASNASRVFFAWRKTRWDLMPKYLIGSVFGTAVFGFIVFNVPTHFVPAMIGIYMLLNLWNPRFSRFIGHYENYYIVGFIQTGLGLVVGAPGPIALTVLTKDLQCKDEIVTTAAMFMTFSHLAKIPVYGFIGFSLTEYGLLIGIMAAAAILGSFIGTHLRKISNNEKLILVIKVLLTFMAFKMIWLVLYP